MPKLFLSQSQLESWALDDKADFNEGALIVAEDGSRHGATPAVHFAKLVSGEDEKHLLSKVKTQTQCGELGAELMGETALVGDTAYEVQPGYLLELKVGAPSPAKKEGGDVDMLARYFLDQTKS